jgi:hypothetical protein
VTSDDTSGTAPPSGPIFFEFDSSTLTPPSRDLLATFATWAIEKKPKLRVEGHTDEQGTTEYNLALGDRRARAISDYLISLGVDASRVDTITYGEEKPAAEGHDESAYRPTAAARSRATRRGLSARYRAIAAPDRTRKALDQLDGGGAQRCLVPAKAARRLASRAASAWPPPAAIAGHLIG